jgi:uncharacterized protein (UPF0333 family)
MRKKIHGQSLLEFAILVPVLVLFVLGAAELTLFIGTYTNVIDLTREAARFASVSSNIYPVTIPTLNCSNNVSTLSNGFFYDTACIFSPIQNSPICTDPNFCNGYNSTTFFKSDQDDILISAFTVSGNHVTAHYPADSDGFPWVWSDHDPDTAHNGNWKHSCDGTNPNETPNPYFTDVRMNAYMQTTNSPLTAKGFVVVEAYYCYYQVMKVPLVGLLFPDPMKLHVYTIMPLPAVNPTATPMTSP